MKHKNSWNVRLYKNAQGTFHVDGKDVENIDLPISARLSHFFGLIENYNQFKWKDGSKKENLEEEFNRYLCALFSLDQLDLELIWYLKNMPITLGLRNRLRKTLRELYMSESELVDLNLIIAEKPFHSCVLDE